ncbi:hypothetical protein F511_13375 [Dorcoceras hygrometricum]|uniref:Uncharacterized protein n=1 Tax=Dorcoceras hygrometricum TaxID=472368 RepID=A0A2Z7BJ16_9LAMI|nr:hypothetical protein F511_13375 [Dorcoceras hygrometricum]
MTQRFTRLGNILIALRSPRLLNCPPSGSTSTSPRRNLSKLKLKSIPQLPQTPQKITQEHNSNSLLKSATHELLKISTGNAYKLKYVKISPQSAYTKAHPAYNLKLPAKERKNHWSTIAKIFESRNYFALLQRVDSGLQTGINRKILKRRAQRHKSYSKRRHKSTAIDREKVRMNSKGFEGSPEEDKKYRVRNRLSVAHHLYLNLSVKATVKVNHSNLDATSDLGAISNLSANPDLTLLRYSRTQSPNEVA